jgi:hypothetical protein
MRLVFLSLAAMFASTCCVALLFLYALIAPTRPLPPPAITKDYALAWTGPGAPRVIAIHTQPTRRALTKTAAATQ